MSNSENEQRALTAEHRVKVFTVRLVYMCVMSTVGCAGVGTSIGVQRGKSEGGGAKSQAADSAQRTGAKAPGVGKGERPSEVMNYRATFSFDYFVSV